MIQGEGDRLKRGETKKSVEETKIFKKGAAGSRNMCLEKVGVGWGGGWGGGGGGGGGGFGTPLRTMVYTLHNYTYIIHIHTYVVHHRHIHNIFSI